MIRFVIHESPEDHQFYVRITSDNNEPWFTSEGYTRDDDAVRSCEDFIANIRKSVDLDSPFARTSSRIIVNYQIEHEIVPGSE